MTTSSAVSHQEVSRRNTVLPLKNNQEDSGEGPKAGGEDQPPRILHSGWVNPSILQHLGWEMQMPPGGTQSQTMGQAKWLARDDPKTNPIPRKPETANHVAEQFSWVPSPCCPPTGVGGCGPSQQSLLLCQNVSPLMIHFQELDKSLLLGLRRGSPFLQQWETGWRRDLTLIAVCVWWAGCRRHREAGHQPPPLRWCGLGWRLGCGW